MPLTCPSHQIMTTVITMGFPSDSDNKESAYNAGDLGSIPGSGGSPGEGNGYPCQYSCLENSMDRGAWWATQSMVLQRDTTEQLSLAHQIVMIITIIKWKKRKICDIHMKLQLISISNLYLHKEQLQWHPTPVLLPGKSHGRRSLVGCSPWGR